MKFLPDDVYLGDARELSKHLGRESVALSVWSPPYHVGKAYERGMSFRDWQELLGRVIAEHAVLLRPGAFLAVNIADILCLKDSSMPRLMGENVARRRRAEITPELVAQAWSKHPGLSRKGIARVLGCSEQTVDRRMKGNNIRGGKYATQTRVKLVGGLIEELALEAGLYLYDRRIWVKDAAWENSRWHSVSYRAVDEFEYVFVLWKPGPTRIDKARLSRDEWIAWGSRAVWNIPSVRANDDHEAKFPLELPRRLIRLFTDPGDLVIDCFAGSGTSGVAAVGLGRRFVGVDNVQKYVTLAKRNLRNALHERSQVNLELFGDLKRVA
ncbi:MAG: modification methylase [Betaproteobacteria bacterium RIFCSPHIGHO2_12_FULL_69_13]|nr:MAG: modification methylase [Betaproteobacteria bacterium RIFCSPHIGHO2_12_FULL_69_13]OGA67874.1 MAG: modification methylase [Betaproteobacteria bacterium RIFCSPLOWO2_12_FULL_68_20]